ncbi:MAG: thioredoxin family protein, partial [Planctomycetaceae bacterium]|nr:thioredoxin family protein [Planctomycetaceae bacterium]
MKLTAPETVHPDRTRWIRAVIVALSLCCCVRPGMAQVGGWYSSIEEARDAARAANLPLLIHFHAWYCSPCRQMDSQVFHDLQVQQALTDGISAVQIDITQDPDLAGEYGASTVPRDVVVYPDGRTETLNVGFVPRTRYLSLLSDIQTRGAQHRALQSP